MENSLKRYSASAVAGVSITAALVLIMHYAIHTDEPNLIDAPDLRITKIFRVIEDIPLTPIKREVVKPQPPITPPPLNKFIPEFQSGGTSTVAYKPPPVKDIPGIKTSVGEGDLLPIMVVAPEYPQRMLSRGIEGWVLVEFSVDQLGRVQEPRVIDAYPSSGFNQSALRAVLRYKYKPRVINGTAVTVRGVQQRIVFNVSV